MIKTISNSILTAFFAVICFCSLSAQGNSSANTTYDQLIDDATTIVVVSSQLSGDLQQLATFISNGNTNQLANRLSDVNQGVAELLGATSAMASRPIIDRLISGQIGELAASSADAAADLREITNALNRNDTEGAEGVAIQMRNKMQPVRKLAQDIRKEVMSSKNDDD